MMGTDRGVAGKVVLLAGATSPSGAAAARALSAAGATVIAVARDADRLEALRGTGADAPGEVGIPGGPAGSDAAVSARSRIRTEVCDLTDEPDVYALAARVGDVDGVVHLVGGWRGGGGLAGQSEEDYRFLENSFTALRHVSRAFEAALRASPEGRLAIVSSTAVARPLAGGANYAAVKAASEAWARAVAQGFAKSARDSGTELHAASVIFRVKSLAGLEGTLADAVVDLWDADASEVNDRVINLG